MSFGRLIDCRMPVLAVAFAIASMGVATDSRAAPLQITIPGGTMPWVSSAKLNKTYPYGIGDGSAPVVVLMSAVHAHSGNTITVTYVSGTVSAEQGTYPDTDANGDTAFAANNGSGNGFGIFPSYYMTGYPIYLCELVGVFTNKKGKIVGQPFSIADGPTAVVVPVGAKALQMGVNDDKFSDNAGSWVVSVKKQNN